MTTIDLTALRKLAEAATPGPWEHVNEPGTNNHTVTASGQLLAHDYEGVWFIREDAEYLAALNPATVLRLIDALEAVLAACDDPNTGPPGDPWTYGYEAALDDIREIITTALGADDD